MISLPLIIQIQFILTFSLTLELLCILLILIYWIIRVIRLIIYHCILSVRISHSIWIKYCFIEIICIIFIINCIIDIFYIYCTTWSNFLILLGFNFWCLRYLILIIMCNLSLLVNANILDLLILIWGSIFCIYF